MRLQLHRRTFVPFLLAAALVAVAVVGSAVTTAEAATARLGSRALRQNDSGPDVAQLQRLLGKAGFKVKPDGQFGPGTLQAVQAFQRVSRLTPSGIADVTTVTALRSALAGGAAQASNGGFSSSASTVKSKSLGDRIPVRRGMSGHDVKILQAFLRKAGVPNVTVDGEFGPGTYRAVKTWERMERRTVDGVVDGPDMDALRQQVSGQAAASPVPAAVPVVAPPQLAAGDRAKVGPDGLAIAPASAPPAVQQIIAAGNQIAKMPYRYGGGHASWNDTGYDCSGSVSYALHGAGLLDAPRPSSGFYNWGLAGPGQWVTIYAKDSHIYMVVAGLRFDTSGRSKAGTRWQADMRSSDGYVVRHPSGL